MNFQLKWDKEFEEMDTNNYMGIDPGPVNSAFVVWDNKEKKIIDKQILLNEDLLNLLYTSSVKVGIEMIESMGMPVGKTTFQTILWIGRFIEALNPNKSIDFHQHLIYRSQIKVYFCNSVRAKDSNIRQALIDRFGEPGTKHNPGLTYGLKKDLWQAFAIAVFLADKKNENR